MRSIQYNNNVSSIDLDQDRLIVGFRYESVDDFGVLDLHTFTSFITMNDPSCFNNWFIPMPEEMIILELQ